MGQANLKRLQFEPREIVTSLSNSAVHTMAYTGYFYAGDAIEIVDVDASGNILSVLGSANVTGVTPNVNVFLDGSIDTSAAVGTPFMRCIPIDDGQEAVDRLYRKALSGSANQFFDLQQAVLAQRLDTPSVGEATYEIADAKFWRAGDLVDVVSDAGIAFAGASLLSVNPLADLANNRSTLVIDESVDTSALTNPRLVNRTITFQLAIERNQQDIDAIDAPVENENLSAGNSVDCAFETANLFKVGSSKVMIDGIRKKLGTAGTRASLTQGAGNAQLIYTSMLLGLLGNEVRVRVVAGAGLTIAVSKTFKASGSGINTGVTSYDISINDNGGAATAAQIAAALNADAAVKRLVQVQYGGTGLGVVAAFAYTALTGGLDNGTGDYAELPQILNNLIVNTGMKWVSFRIVPADKNRMNEPPQSDEEQTIDYRKILVNA